MDETILVAQQSGLAGLHFRRALNSVDDANSEQREPIRHHKLASVINIKGSVPHSHHLGLLLARILAVPLWDFVELALPQSVFARAQAVISVIHLICEVFQDNSFLANPWVSILSKSAQQLRVHVKLRHLWPSTEPANGLESQIIVKSSN